MKGLKGFQKGHKINKGKKYSKKRKSKISATLRGRIFTKKWKKKLSLSHKGKKQSEITKKKISKTVLGKAKPWLKGKKPWNYQKKSPQTSGKKNGNWKGGITPKNHKTRTSLEMKLWKKACLERDNFTDQKTEIRGGELEVHHINNFADFPEIRFAIDNGITLSKKSHKDFHKKYGSKNNTREQLQEFLLTKSKI